MAAAGGSTRGRVSSRRPRQPFPSPTYRGKGGVPVRKRDEVFQHEVYVHLCRRTTRRLNDLHKAGHPMPTLEQLTDETWTYAEARLRKALGRLRTKVDQGSGEVNHDLYTLDHLDRAAATAAAFCLRGFDPDYLKNRAAAGGRSSKRRPVYTPDMLLGHEGERVAYQASAVGCSAPTIKNLRRQYPAYRERLQVVAVERDGLVPNWPAPLTRPQLIGTEEWHAFQDEHGGLFAVGPVTTLGTFEAS